MRTLADLGAVDPPSVSDAVGHVVANRLAGLEALEVAAAEHSRRGRPGIPVLRAALDEWAIDGKPTDSLLEGAMSALIDRFDLPPVVFHPVIEGFEVDFRVAGTPVILECDGWAYHGRRRSVFESDRTRDADLVAAGWIVVRFTYRAVTSNPNSTAKRISAAVARWSGIVAPDTPDDAA